MKLLCLSDTQIVIFLSLGIVMSRFVKICRQSGLNLIEIDVECFSFFHGF